MTNAPEANSENTSIETSDDSDKKLANLVNAAVSSHMKRFMKQFEATQSEKQVSQSSSQTPSSPASDDSDVRKELAKMKAELRAEKAKAREEKVFSDVRSRLSGKVRDDAVDLALKVFRADQKIVIDEEGNTVFRHEGIDHDIEDGIAEWLQSKEAAVFRPAPTAKKVPGKTQVKAPARSAPAGGFDDPASKTLAQLQKLGISI